jgi:hypothetical protein
MFGAARIAFMRNVALSLQNRNLVRAQAQMHAGGG